MNKNIRHMTDFPMPILHRPSVGNGGQLSPSLSVEGADRVPRRSLAKVFGLGLMVMAFLFASVLLINIFTLLSVRSSVEDLASSTLPEVTASAEVINMINRLVSHTENLTQATSDSVRRVAYSSITSEFSQLRAMIERRHGVDDWGKQLDSLEISLAELNTLVSNRLDVAQKLVRAQQKLFTALEDALAASYGPEERDYAPLSSAERAILSQWAAVSLRMVKVAGALTFSTSYSQFRLIEMELENQEKTWYSLPLPKDVEKYLQPYSDTVLDGIFGPGGVLELSRELLAVTGKCTGKSNFSRALVNEVNFGRNRSFYTMLSRAESESVAIGKGMARSTIVVSLLSVFALLLTAGSIWYGQVMFLKRLARLNRTVRRKVRSEGDDPIEVSGNDEITDIAASVNYFATQLSLAKHAAEHSSLAKSDFLANMSHEIRTPMNAVVGFAHLLEQTDLTVAQRNSLCKLTASAHSLLGIINDVLDFSKIDAGRLTLEHVPFGLSGVLDGALSLVSLKAQAKKIVLETNIDEDVPTFLIGDPLRLGQILNNLCSNAEKFTSQGFVRIRVSLVKEYAREETAGEVPNGHPPQSLAGLAANSVFPAGYTFSDSSLVCLRFTVTDSGIGMNDVEISRLFIAFSQADASITRRFGGTGLGLAICKRLVELMDGEISVESRLGDGSTFAFTAFFGKMRSEDLPTVRAEEIVVLPPLPCPEPVPSVECRKPIESGTFPVVLLVEDNEINREIACAILQSMYLDVECASNGREAVNMVKSKAYALIFMDIQMPEMDGLTAARTIRTLPEGTRVPILAMTAHAMVGDKEKSLHAGMDDHLTKPIMPDELKMKIRYWLVHEHNGAQGEA